MAGRQGRILKRFQKTPDSAIVISPSFFQWLPLVLGAVAIALAALSIGQYFSFKRDVARLRRELGDIEPLEAKVVELASELAELRERVGEREPAAGPRPDWGSGAGTGLTAVNLNRRGQVLRLRRRGRTVEEIASTLEIPRGEVELMVKVHDLSQTPAGSGPGL